MPSTATVPPRRGARHRLRERTGMAANGLDDHIEVVVAFDDRNATELDGQRTLVLVTGREADFSSRPPPVPPRCSAGRPNLLR